MLEIRQKLEKVFTEIEQQRMRDIPICNPALSVRAFGFDEWGKYYLGIMLTPWFMNLMLLPRDAEEMNELGLGEKKTHVFPSGIYEFVVGEETKLGKYQVCSLFSPMFEFKEQMLAEETAQAVLEEIMQAHNNQAFDAIEKSTEQQQTPQHEEESELSKMHAENVNISRRNFLRGKMSANR